VVDVSPSEIFGAIKTIEGTVFPSEAQSAIRLALAGLKTLLAIYGWLGRYRITVDEVRRRLGIPAPARDQASGKDGNDVAPPAEQATASDKTNSEAATAGGGDTRADKNKAKLRKDGQAYGRDEHGRRGKEDFPDARQRFFAHPDFDRAGSLCPFCQEMRVYLMGAIGGGLRFAGQPSLTATVMNREIWRCGNCSAHFPAPLPPDIETGGGQSRVGYTAAAQVAVGKYIYGTPWARQEAFGSLLDLDLPATTQWEMVRRLVKAALPVYRYLYVVAAAGYLFFSDDTGAIILGVRVAEKPRRTTGETVERTGVHTSCIVAVLSDEREIILYKTGIIHAGEFMDEVLQHRPKDLPPPFHMSDGHSANPPIACKVIGGDCNVHGRRKVEEKRLQWSAVWCYVKSVYKVVYANEAKAKEEGFDANARLDLHREKSLPVMRAMFSWMQSCLDKRIVEPNSNLGKVFNYFLIRERGLTMFCRHPGFPIDNNRCESAQKLVAMHRKNAEYFRTERGAEAADVIMSLGATTTRSGGNAFHYFVMLQRFEVEVTKSPERFLPWNYRETVAALEKASPQPRRVLEVSEAEFKDRAQQLRSTKAWGRSDPPSLRTVAAVSTG